MASGGAVDRLKDHHGTENDEHRTRDPRMSNLCLIKSPTSAANTAARQVKN